MLIDLDIATETSNTRHTFVGLYINRIEVHRGEITLLIVTQRQRAQFTLGAHLVDNGENLLRGNTRLTQ